MGLSQNTVYCFCQDDKGFMWIGTQEGLNKFDGSHISVYRHSPEQNSIQDNYVSALRCSDGNIYIGTLNGRLSYYEPGFNRFTEVSEAGPSTLSGTDTITQISETQPGKLYISTLNSGLYTLHSTHDSGLLTFLPHNKYPGKVSCFADIDDKHFILGTLGNGLWIVNSDTRACHKVKIKSMSNDSQKHYITSILNYQENEIMVGTRTGIFKYLLRLNEHDSEMIELESLLNGRRVTSMSVDQNSTVWVGTGNSGLFGIYPSGRTINSTHSVFDKGSLSSNAVMSLFVDRSNVLWIGLADSGVCMTDGDFKRFHSINYYSIEGTSDLVRNVHSILESRDGSVWIGTYNGSLLRFAKQTEFTFRCLDTSWIANESGIIVSILEDQAENIWAVHFNGSIVKCKVKYNTSETYRANTHITSAILVEDTIYLTTLGNGILSFDIKRNAFSKTLNSDGYIVSEKMTYFFIIRLKQGVFLAGTEEAGAIPFAPEVSNGSALEVLSSALTNSSYNTFAISAMEDDHNSIWIGTYSNGLLRVGKDSSMKRLSKSEGIHDNIKGILSDEKDSIWLSTNIGLYKLNGNDYKTRHFDFTDGLTGNEFNDRACCRTKDGTLFFGGINGITYFRPEEIKDNPHIPNIVLTEFEIFNKPVVPSPENPFLKKNIAYADEINLTYRESVFSFGFAALSFNNPQKNQYAYKMEGFDKDWTYCGKRKRVTYTNLDPGQYVFRVIGSNNDGIWNEEGTSIRINISPPYWKTWWFRTLGALAAVAATGLTYKQRLQKMEMEKLAQEEFSRRLIESQEDERKRISSELHDTVAHDVLIARNKAQFALKHKDNADKMEAALKEISELAASTMKDVRSISYNLHPHQLEQLGFTKSLKSIIMEVSKSTDINFKSEIDDVDNLLSKENEINLFRAIQESVSNVLKHSEAKVCYLKVGRRRGSVLILLADDGKGFDKKSIKLTGAKRGLGIKGISERIKFMKGEYRIDSQPGKGTTVIYKIPINERNEKGKSNPG